MMTTKRIIRQWMNQEKEKVCVCVCAGGGGGGGVDETGKENRKNKVENFISESAVVLIEGSLKNRGFIAERGFKNIISPFAEMVEKREWQSLAEHKEPGCVLNGSKYVPKFYNTTTKRLLSSPHQ